MAEMLRRRVRTITAGLLLGGLLTCAVPASAATRIVFRRGAYCGTYSGDFREGRQFVLGLRAGQRFTSRNIGVGVQSDVSVVGPTGKLYATRDSYSQLSFYTQASGSHYVWVVSSAANAAIEFCAY